MMTLTRNIKGSSRLCSVSDCHPLGLALMYSIVFGLEELIIFKR